MTDSSHSSTETKSAGPERTGIRGLLDRWNAAVEKRLRESVDRQVVSAFIMVVISVMGAVAAYQVGLAEQRSIVLERRLAHGQLQDIGFRQELLAEVLVKIELTGLENRLTTDAAEFRRAFNSLPKSESAAANWLEWRAAELVLQRNVVRRFSLYLNDLTTNKSVETELAEKSADELRRQGFLAVADQGPDARSAVQFPQLQSAIDRAHDLSSSLSLCVLLFVTGLVCLTLAELDLGPALVWLLLVALGTAIGAGATVAVVTIDPVAAWIIGPLVAVLVVAVWLAQRNGIFRVPHDRSHAAHPEAPEPGRVSFAHLAGHAGHDGWSRSIVLYITAAVFVSAVFGWFYSTSLKHSGHYALEAQAKKTELVNQRGRLGAVAMGGVFDISIKILTARIRCTSATQLWALADEGMMNIDAERAESERKQRCADMEALIKDKEIFISALDDNDLADSANNPTRRLNDNIMDRPGGPQETLALSDGYAEVSVGWNKRAALLLAVLTILAISLYLFGQAYTMGQTLAGRWLIRSGGTLLGISICLGLFAWVRPIVEAPAAVLPKACLVEPPKGDKAANDKAHAQDDDEDDTTRSIKLAARLYGDGVRQSDIGETAPMGSQERAEADTAAAQSFECAVLARPGFIPAYRKYVRVLSRMDSPQRGIGSYISLNSRTRLGEVHVLQKRELKAFAAAGMLRPLNQLGNFAFDSTVMALADGKPDALAEARAALDVITGRASWWRRLQIEWTQPELWSEEPPSSSSVDWFNRGLSQLATGDAKQMAQGEDSYDTALKNKDDWTPELLASALTDIEILRTYCANLHPGGDTCARIFAAIDRIRPRIANGIPSTGTLALGSAEARDFSATVSPHALTWRMKLKDFDAKRDRLTVAWFRDETRPAGAPVDPKRWQVRHALDDFFEMYYPGGYRKLPQAAAGGTIVREVSTLDAASTCMMPGRYAVELFLNGKLIQTQTVNLEPHDLRFFRSRDLDLTWCIPKSWQPWSGNATSHPWFADKPMRGFVVPNGKDGYALGGAMMTFFAPPSMPPDRRKAYFLRRAIQILMRKGDAGGKDTPPSGWTQSKEDSVLRNAIALDGLSDADCQGKDGLREPVYRYFTDRSDKNLIHIGVVDGRIAAKESCTILKSLSNHF